MKTPTTTITTRAAAVRAAWDDILQREPAPKPEDCTCTAGRPDIRCPFGSHAQLAAEDRADRLRRMRYGKLTDIRGIEE